MKKSSKHWSKVTPRWETSKGKKIAVSKLEDHHLLAAILKIEPARTKGKKKRLYASLLKEAVKRGLPVVSFDSWHS